MFPAIVGRPKRIKRKMGIIRVRTKLTCDVDLIIIWLLFFSNVSGHLVAERLPY